MIKIDVDTDSWHYRLATEYGSYNPNKHGDDICAYGRRMFGGVIFALFLVGIGSLFGWVIVDGIMGLIFSVIVGEYIVGTAGTVFLLFTAIGSVYSAICWLIYRLIRAYKDYRCKNTLKASKPQESVISAIYKSWKNKFCLKINIIAKDNS